MMEDQGQAMADSMRDGAEAHEDAVDAMADSTSM